MRSNSVSTLLGLFLLTRPENGLLAFGGTLIGARLAGAAALDGRVLLAGAGISLLVLSADAINDTFDVAIDAVNRPYRPIPSGRVTVRQALALALALDVAGIGLGLLVSPLVGLVGAAAAALNILYSWKLKGIILAGNAAIAALVVIPLVVGGLSIGLWGALTVPVLTALFFSLGREILMDARDREGDAHGGARTVAVHLGQRPALALAGLCFGVALTLGLIPGLTGTFSRAYLILMLIGTALMAYLFLRGWRGRTPADLEVSVVGSKGVLLLALVALALAPT